MLRSPAIAILGHVDTGKTKLGDYLRKSTTREDGDITQEIGATKLNNDTLNKLMKPINKQIEHPGLLLIDTPGHEPFSSLRIVASDICDFAIVVVNIFKGVEEQTREVIKLLKRNKKPFIIVANMIDKIDGWKSDPKILSIKKSSKKQNKFVLESMEKHINNIIATFAMEEINACLYSLDRNPQEWVYIVPVSSYTGEGIPELIYQMTKLQLKFMSKKLTYKEDNSKGYILEISKDKQQGYILKTILINGILRENDKIIVNTFDDTIDININNILIQDKNKKYIRIKEACACEYLILKGDFPHQILQGSRFFVINNDEEEKNYKKKLDKDRKLNDELLNENNVDKLGVHLHSNSYGTIDALVKLTRKYNIPISNISVGNLGKTEIIKTSQQIRQSKTNDELLFRKLFGVIFVFNCDIPTDIEEFAKEQKVKIISEKVIFNIIDRYSKLYNLISNKFKENYPQIKPETSMIILPEHIFCYCNPLIFGVRVKKYNDKRKNKFTSQEYIVEHSINKNINIKATKNDKTLYLGKILSIQKDKTELDIAKEGMDVCIKLENPNKYEYDKDFDSSWNLESYTPSNVKDIEEKYSEFLL